jgi:hypothetical protein
MRPALTGNVERMGESKYIFKVSVRKTKVRNQLEDRIVDGRTIH